MALSTYAVTIPAGTQIEARLTSEVSSNATPGQPVSAVVTASPLVNGLPALPRGAVLNGMIRDVTAAAVATDTQPEKAGTVRIDFTATQLPGGPAQPLSAVVSGVDNARESVDDSGLITGIKASQTYTARMDQGISKVANRYPDFAEILTGVKSALVKPADPTIDFKPGVDFTLKLTKPLNWIAPPNLDATHQDAIGVIQPQRTLLRLVAAEPIRTTAQNPPSPSDLTNLMFIGTRDQLQAAFTKAGWFPADPLGRSAKFQTALAIIEDRGYNEAPVSLLFLDGRPPDLVYQKQTDTFAMRHHIRIWLRPETFAGSPVWMAAATHDIKISYSQTSHNFTHGIDSHIDLERSKVVNDLEFTGLVKAFSLIPRQAIPANVTNATGDLLLTDGKLAVLSFF